MTDIELHLDTMAALLRMHAKRHQGQGCNLTAEQNRRVLDLIDRLVVWHPEDPRIRDRST
jgi:hypothetical protein